MLRLQGVQAPFSLGPAATGCPLQLPLEQCITTLPLAALHRSLVSPITCPSNLQSSMPQDSHGAQHVLAVLLSWRLPDQPLQQHAVHDPKTDHHAASMHAAEHGADICHRALQACSSSSSSSSSHQHSRSVEALGSRAKRGSCLLLWLQASHRMLA